MTPSMQMYEPQSRLPSSRADESVRTSRSMSGRRETGAVRPTGTCLRDVLVGEVALTVQVASRELLNLVGMAQIEGFKSIAKSTAKSPAKSVGQGCGKLSTLSRPPAVITGSVRTPRPMTTRPPRFLKWWGSGSHRPGIAGVNPDDGRAACRRKSPEGATESAGAGSQTTAWDSIWVPRWLPRGRRELPQELQDARTLPLLRGPVSLVSCLVRNRGLDQSVSGGAEVSDGW